MALDIYVFCLSEHPPDNYDGVLSMWRAYGGSGNGAAIVFKTADLIGVPELPLFFTKVTYELEDDRRAWIRAKSEAWCNIVLRENFPESLIPAAVERMITVVKGFALTRKDKSFGEEEWRVIYDPTCDSASLLTRRAHYVVGARGVEPKLKLKLKPLPGVTSRAVTLDQMLERIILGPSLSSPLAQSSYRRMLELIGKGDFKSRVYASRFRFAPHDRRQPAHSPSFSPS